MTEEIKKLITEYFEKHDTSEAVKLVNELQTKHDMCYAAAYAAVSSVLADKWLSQEDDPELDNEADTAKSVDYQLWLIGYTGNKVNDFEFMLGAWSDYSTALECYSQTVKYPMKHLLRAFTEMTEAYCKSNSTEVHVLLEEVTVYDNDPKAEYTDVLCEAVLPE